MGSSNSKKLEEKDRTGNEPVRLAELDRRTKVDNPERWPFCVHGRITAHISAGAILLGSGTMIGPNLVLTSAHNCYDSRRGMKIDPKTIRFYAGLNGNLAPFGSSQVKSVYYPEQFASHPSEDLALLVLDNRLGDYTGYFGLYQSSPDELQGINSSLYGYPAQTQNSDQAALLGMEGTFEIDRNNDAISHWINTSAGQGGSPLYIQAGDKYYIFGVHTGKDSTGIGKAVFLNETRIGRIRQLIEMVYRENNIQEEIDLTGAYPIKPFSE